MVEKVISMEKFCYWHEAVADDFNEDGTQKSWTCMAHLAEGRAFGCAYTSLENAKEQQYPCMDAKPPT